MTLVAGLALAGCSSAGDEGSGPVVSGAAIGVEGAHEHGVLRMGFAVDGTRLTLDLQAPGDAVFGFEHEPSSDEERAVVAEAMDRMRTRAPSVLSVPAELRCAPDEVRIVEAPDAHGAEHGEEGEEHADHDEDGHEEHDDHGEEHDDHGEEHDDHGEEHAGEGEAHDDHGHSEVRLTVVWNCASSVEGSPASLRFGDLFRDVEQVDLTVITSQGQAAARVAADAAFRF